MNQSYDPTKDPHLATWRERSELSIRNMRCPQCRQKGYKPYIHPDGQIVAEECGRCDHESSCGYHVSPKEWFKEHPNNGEHYNPSYVPPPPPPAIRIDARWAQRFYCLNITAGRNPLLRYWVELFRNVRPEHKPIAIEYEERMRDVLKKFCVGTYQDMTIWWITDEQGNIRSGKMMAYKPDGHRDKDNPQGFRWMHNMAEVKAVQAPNAEYVGCLFGLHQLTKHTKEVHIVESEKTAVLMSVFKPSVTWMATMGLSNLNDYRLAPLLDKDITIVCHPDYDGHDKWMEKVEAIKTEHPKAKISVSQYVKKAWMLGDPQNADILDIMERDYKLLYMP